MTPTSTTEETMSKSAPEIKTTIKTTIQELPLTPEPLGTPDQIAAQVKADEKNKYSKEELLKIFDELIFEGEYKEDITIRGKLRVTFRSRTTEETMEVAKFLDTQEYNLLITMQQERAVRNLAYSLVNFQGKDLAGIKHEDKLKFVQSKPMPILMALADKLSEFDVKVEMACREAEENF